MLQERCEDGCESCETVSSWSPWQASLSSTQCSPSKLGKPNSENVHSTSCKATPSLVLRALSKTFTAASEHCGVVCSELSSPHPNCCTRNNNLRSPEIQTIPGSPVVVLYYRKRVSALGPKFSSQGHFHSLQLLNVPQFLFSRLERLKTSPRCNFSHA